MRQFIFYLICSLIIITQLIGCTSMTETQKEREARVQSSPQSQSGKLGAQTFVSKERIAQLQTLTPTNFDLSKLVRLCEEINITYDGGALLATVMLTRAILDHVPPIFGQKAFIMWLTTTRVPALLRKLWIGWRKLLVKSLMVIFTVRFAQGRLYQNLNK